MGLLQFILQPEPERLDFLTYFAAQSGFKVRVAIPTTVAVRDAYNFIFTFTQIDVGYAAGREIKYSPSTQLVFGTTGHFTQKILYLCRAANGAITEQLRSQIKVVLGDIIFVDEVHTATVDITLLIGLINYVFRLPTGQYAGPKIIFSTATFNHGDIMEFFPSFPIYQVSVNMFPTETIWLQEEFDPKKDDLDDKIESIIRQELNRWSQSEKKYHVIVFRPGVNEVDNTLEYLQNSFEESDPVEFYPAYSRLTPDEIDEIFKPSQHMKVVVGTNIIESSITIEDVAVVIDDMLTKVAETSTSGGQRLALEYVSQAETKQRSGRTGRTMAGRVYNLCTESFFKKLPPFRQREIDRVPIYNTVLQLLEASLNPQVILRISGQRYEQAKIILSKFGMISQLGSGYSVTEIGKFVSSMTLGIQNAFMIYLGFQQFKQRPEDQVEQILFRTILAVACMLEVYEPGYFFVPRKDRGETQSDYLARRDVHVEKYHEKFRGDTDIHTLVNIFWEMIDFIRVARSYDRASRSGFYDYVRNFSNDNMMNNKKLREMLVVLRDVETTVLNMIDSKSPITLQNVYPEGGYGSLGNRIAQIFAQGYFVNTFTRGMTQKGEAVYIDEKTGISYRLSGRSSFSRIVFNNTTGPEKIVAGFTIEVQGKRGIVSLCSVFVDQRFIQ